MTRLLIIDDEPKMTDILQRVLRREGYEIKLRAGLMACTEPLKK